MADREDITTHSYYSDKGSPLVPLLITLVLLAFIVFLFWIITATSMAGMNTVRG